MPRSCFVSPAHPSRTVLAVFRWAQLGQSAALQTAAPSLRPQSASASDFSSLWVLDENWALGAAPAGSDGHAQEPPPPEPPAAPKMRILVVDDVPMVRLPPPPLLDMHAGR